MSSLWCSLPPPFGRRGKRAGACPCLRAGRAGGALDDPDRDRWPPRRRGLAPGARGHDVHAARPRRRQAGHRTDRAAPGVRRRGVVCRRAAARPRACADCAAARPPRPERRSRRLLAVSRSPPRPSDGRRLQRERRGRSGRRRRLQRLVGGQLVGRRVGVRREDGRRRVDGGDADPVLAASLHQCRAPHVRHQRAALHPAQERARLAGPRAQDRERAGLADGPSRGTDRRVAASHAGAAAVSLEPCRVRGPVLGRRPLQRRHAPLRQRRTRSEVPADQQPHARRHDQPRLRSGRGRSGRRQPDGLRDVLRGEAAVLHRRGEHLQQLRAQRREQLLGIQPVGADHLLFAADRPLAAGRRRRRVRGSSERDDDSGRRQAHGEDAERLDGGAARGRDRARARADRHAGICGSDRSRTALQLPRRARPARKGARRDRADRDRRQPRSAHAGASEQTCPIRRTSAASMRTTSSTANATGW